MFPIRQARWPTKALDDHPETAHFDTVQKTSDAKEIIHTSSMCVRVYIRPPLNISYLYGNTVLLKMGMEPNATRADNVPVQKVQRESTTGIQDNSEIYSTASQKDAHRLETTCTR